MSDDKSLKDKAIQFKGKDYVLVSDRVLYFNETYKQGSIETELISEPNSELVVVKATVSPDGARKFTGYSQAKWGQGYINTTSALENAETSAVGRALAFMGIGVIESIASADEIRKADDKPRPVIKDAPKKAEIKKLCDELDPTLTGERYRAFIKAKTELEPTPENFDEIINRLTAIKNEK